MSFSSTTRESPETSASLHDLTFPQLETRIAAAGLSAVHARTVWRAMYRDLATSFAEREDFPRTLREWLGAAALEIPAVSASTTSTEDHTTKTLLRMRDGQTIETVLMGYPGRFTACVSTQAGCAMGCVFCATGQMGFARHLRPGEIVAQVLHGQRELCARGEPGLRNLVLMGMGEPLHNYDAVMTALEIIADRRGLNIGPRHITISTVGVVPGIVRLAEEARPYHLAVSMHGATEEDRAALVPVSSRWPLRELIAACRAYCAKTARRIFFEWTLIAGRNDSVAHAATLAALLRGIDAHVNVIPLNPTRGFGGAPSAADSVRTFQQTLKAAGIPSTVRQRRGIDVLAGCGQLRAEKARAAA